MLRITSYLCTILLLAVLFEGASALFWTQYGASRIAYHERVDLKSIPFGKFNAQWRNSGLKSDLELGWITDPQQPTISSNGTRLDGGGNVGAPISAYGDSFVYGADVENDQTFPHYLSRRFGVGVANYGVSGYGPDQALLRLERHLTQGQRPKIVVLGMPSENIARVVNIYRKLYIPLEHPGLAKPVFAVRDGTWKLLNVLSLGGDSSSQRRRVSELVEQYDYWHAQNDKRPRFSFPYSLATLTAIKFFALDVARWQDLFRSPRARSVLLYVLERFVDLSQRYDFVPVFVVVPMPEDLLNINDGGKSFFGVLVEEVAQKFGDRLLVVKVLDQTFAFDRFHVRPYSGHASAYGNQIIAEAIHKNISAARPGISDNWRESDSLNHTRPVN